MSKTSSLIIDLKNSSFEKLRNEFSVCQFHLPSSIKEKSNAFPYLHNWAKDSLDLPYYLNLPDKRLYVLKPLSSTMPDLEFENVGLRSEPFNDWSNPMKTHVILKLLTARYFEIQGTFVSNDKFYLYASTNRSNSWATVLKVEISHNYKNRESFEFFVKDEATRLKAISHEEFEKYHSRDIIYGQSINEGQSYFKQLKRKEIRGFTGKLFTKPSSALIKNTKAKIHFHSILDSESHESSKGFLLERFVSNFLNFINDYGIKAYQKELKLSKVLLHKEVAQLVVSNIDITLVDGRKNKQKPLVEYFDSTGNITFNQKSFDLIRPDDRCLFVMDYNSDDFQERFKGEEDPYKSFKSQPELRVNAKQGICVNEKSFDSDLATEPVSSYLNYSGLNSDDLRRNQEICISQLLLKEALIKKDASYLPNTDSLRKYAFAYRNHLMWLLGNQLVVKQFESTRDLLDQVQSIYPGLELETIVSNVYDYHNPFGLKDGFDLLNNRLMISEGSVFEIVDIPERSFYDEEELSLRIAERNRRRLVKEFFSLGDDKESEAYNSFLVENVKEIVLSYEELKAIYGKGESGFLKQVFNTKDERKYVQFLNQHTTLPIKGIKQDNVFSTYSGVWFDSDQSQYYVGKSLGYNQKQDKGFQMKKVVSHYGTFPQDDFFKLLNVDFIRYKEITVNPYPFKLIEMYETLINESTL